MDVPDIQDMKRTAASSSNVKCSPAKMSTSVSAAPSLNVKCSPAKMSPVRDMKRTAAPSLKCSPAKMSPTVSDMKRAAPPSSNVKCSPAKMSPAVSDMKRKAAPSSNVKCSPAKMSQTVSGMKRKAAPYLNVECSPAKMSPTLSGIDEANQILDDVIRTIEDVAKPDKSSADFLKYIKSVRGKVGTVPKKIKVGVFGRTGVGKSFLINTILGENLLPSGSGSACTSVIIQVAANTQDANFIAEIEFISKEVWQEELKTLLRILDQGTKEYDKDEIKSARDKIKAIYGIDGNKKNLEELLLDDIQPLKQKKLTKSFDTAESLEEGIRCYVKSGHLNSTQRYYWPLVKSVTIKVPSHNDILENLVLMDIPGAGDINKSRREMGKKCRRECSTVWIVSDINRAADDLSAWDLLAESLKDLAYGGECSSIAYVCTKTDVMNAEEYMRNCGLTDRELGITEERQGQDYEKMRRRKCILHRNDAIRKQIEEEFNEQVKNELKDCFTHEDLKVYMVSSAEFKKMSTEDDLLPQKDTEIPKLRKLLRMLSRSFPQKREVDYIKEAQGVLSLIQGSNCDSNTDVEFSNAFTKLEKNLQGQLNGVSCSLREMYNTLDCCLSKWAKESEMNCLERAEMEVIKPNIRTAQGYHKTLRALCEKGGATKSTSTGKVTDLNKVLVSHMQEKVDKTFENLFEGLRRRALRGPHSLASVIDTFEVTHEVIPEFKIPVTLILTFIETQQAKLKTILRDYIIEKKKEIFNCLEETIEFAMDPVYTDAASKTGDGSYAKMQNVLRNGINTYRSTMFKEAKQNSLKMFKDMIDYIEATLRELEDIAKSALSRKHSIRLPDISEEVEKMKELRTRVESQKCV